MDRNKSSGVIASCNCTYESLIVSERSVPGESLVLHNSLSMDVCYLDSKPGLWWSREHALRDRVANLKLGSKSLFFQSQQLLSSTRWIHHSLHDWTCKLSIERLERQYLLTIQWITNNPHPWLKHLVHLRKRYQWWGNTFNLHCHITSLQEGRLLPFEAITNQQTDLAHRLEILQRWCDLSL